MESCKGVSPEKDEAPAMDRWIHVEIGKYLSGSCYTSA
jgi:hypothetical protein